MNKFWNNTKEVEKLRKSSEKIFEQMKEQLDKSKNPTEKIYTLPNFFLLFFKLEIIRQ